MKATIKDIARNLNVSVGLVSTVLNGRSDELRISEKMQKKVLEEAKRLNYTPNLAAKSLRTGKLNTIGVLFPDISNPFFAKLARHIENAADHHGYNIIFSSSDEDAKKFETQVYDLRNGKVDGFILFPPPGSDHVVQDLVKAKVPLVLVDRNFKDIKTTNILINNYQSSKNATNHLLEQNFQKIVHFTVNLELEIMKERLRGFSDSLQEKNIPVLENNNLFVFNFPTLEEDIASCMDKLMGSDRKPDAIFCSTNKITVMVLDILKDKNISIPSDVALLSFDDPEFFRLMAPSITGLAQPLNKMGEKAVNCLLQRFNKKSKGEPENYLFDAELIVRDSTLKNH